MSLEIYKKKLLKKAKKKHGKIFPTMHRKTFKNCFQETFPCQLWLWYNDSKNYTHIAKIKIPKKLSIYNKNNPFK